MGFVAGLVDTHFDLRSLRCNWDRRRMLRVGIRRLFMRVHDAFRQPAAADLRTYDEVTEDGQHDRSNNPLADSARRCEPRRHHTIVAEPGSFL